MLTICAIQAEIEIAKEKADISNSIWLNHVLLTEEANLSEYIPRHIHSLIRHFLPTLQMRVYEAKDSIVQAELDHDASFPAITNQIFHDIVLFDVAHEESIIFFYKDGEEHLTFAHHLDHVKLMLQIALNVTHFLFLLATALLAAIGDYIVIAVIGEEFVDVDVLRLRFSSVVPGDGHNVERHLPIYKLTLPRGHTLCLCSRLILTIGRAIILSKQALYDGWGDQVARR